MSYSAIDHLKRPIYILLLFLLWGSSSYAMERENLLPEAKRLTLVDSVMHNVHHFAPTYEKVVGDYKADLYIKGTVHVKKRNHLIRYIPSLFKMKKGVDFYILETMSDLHYSYPNIYDQKVKASQGTIPANSDYEATMLQYFRVNIYSSTLLYNKLYSPLSPNGGKYYTYELDSVMGPEHQLRYKIRFSPKTNSYQLVRGYMVVSANTWSVREVFLQGRSEFFRFSNYILMGQEGDDNEYLPSRFDVGVSFRFLGNRIDGTYSAALDYRSITLQEPQALKKRERKYDLSDSYRLSCDTNAFHRDSTYFAQIRPVELNSLESYCYRTYEQGKDSTQRTTRPALRKSKVFLGALGDVLLSDYTVDLASAGSVKCSPLINPFLISYGHNDGFSYRQEFKYSHLFQGDRLLKVRPRIGYNFTRKEFYWSVNGDFDYWPEKRAAVHLQMGNGNRIYSSDVLDELKQLPDSVFDFSKINLRYFKDLYFNLQHSMEVVNGLTLSVGVSMHQRKEAYKSKFYIPMNADRPIIDNALLSKIKHAYVSFAPRVKVEWTPYQYYYMNGRRKINLYSHYPTFSADWERGIRGVFGSTGVYERLELDMQHKISLGLMRSFYYRCGFGLFTNQEQLFFVDFVNFSKNNLPSGWNDDIGGTFQLLDRRFYNSSRRYIRANLTYETPFLLLPRLMKRMSYVLNERLYLNVLTVPHLKPYVELGYGIGTHIFDVGVFTSNANGKFDQVGCKFTFELFNR